MFRTEYSLLILPQREHLQQRAVNVLEEKLATC